MRRLAGIGLALIVAVGLPACHRGGQTGLGRLTVDGKALVAGPSGSYRTAGGSEPLVAGSRVRMVSGTATIRLADNGSLELRSGTQLVMDAVPTLQGGDLLVQPGRQPVRIATDQAEAVVPSGAARLSRGFGLTAVSYQGTLALQVPGAAPLLVKAPRQANVASRDLLPAQATPAVYRQTDAWDRRFLGGVEQVAGQLAAATTGFDAQLAPGQGSDAGFYEQLLPDLARQPDFGTVFRSAATTAGPALTPTRPPTPGGYLVASAIALRGRLGSFDDRWRGELSFAVQGADWGMVAYDQAVSNPDAVTEDVLQAIGRAPLQFTLPSPPAVPSLAATGPLSSGAGPGAGGVTGAAGAGGVGGAGSGGAAPSPGPAPGPVPGPVPPPLPAPPVPAPIQIPHLPPIATPVDQIVDPLVDPVIDSLNGALGGVHP